MSWLSKEEVQNVKNSYPKGTKIELLHMSDTYRPIAPGTKGEVVFVDDAGTIHVNWGNGRGLALVPGEDSFKIINKPEKQKLNLLSRNDFDNMLKENRCTLLAGLYNLCDRYGNASAYSKKLNKCGFSDDFITLSYKKIQKYVMITGVNDVNQLKAFINKTCPPEYDNNAFNKEFQKNSIKLLKTMEKDYEFFCAPGAFEETITMLFSKEWKDTYNNIKNNKDKSSQDKGDER